MGVYGVGLAAIIYSMIIKIAIAKLTLLVMFRNWLKQHIILLTPLQYIYVDFSERVRAILFQNRQVALC